MKTIAVIPARYASTRMPGKPLADVLGKPMIWWVYQAAKACPGSFAGTRPLAGAASRGDRRGSGAPGRHQRGLFILAQRDGPRAEIVSWAKAADSSIKKAWRFWRRQAFCWED